MRGPPGMRGGSIPGRGDLLTNGDGNYPETAVLAARRNMHDARISTGHRAKVSSAVRSIPFSLSFPAPLPIVFPSE